MSDEEKKTTDEEKKKKSIFGNDMDIDFPVITISLSYDDTKEPIHVDLGSVQPFIAKAILEQILDSIDSIIVGPKITLNGITLLEAEPIYDGLEISFLDDDDDDDDD